MVEVTQGDKARADRWLDRPSDTPARRSERDRLAVQFARHRLAERDAVVKWLRETWRTDIGVIECLDIADAIEAGEPFK